MATRIVNISNTPADVVAGQSLDAGRYIMENVSTSGVFVNFQDAALSDTAALTRGHIIREGEKIGLDLDAGNVVYVWSFDPLGAAVVAITEE